MASGLEKKLSPKDVLTMTQKTSLMHADFLNLFAVLDMEDDEVERAELAAQTRDVKIRDGCVLKGWIKKTGKNASRRKIIDALADCELIDAKEKLEKAWGLVTEDPEDNEDRGQAKKKTLYSEPGPLPDGDDYMDVEPDGEGSYTERHIKAANPTHAQLTDKNYFMSSEVKGLAYILNNNFQGVKGRERRGSVVDFTNIQHLFRELGYTIIPRENLGSEEIRESIKNFVSRFKEANYSSAVVVLMSHGNTGIIEGTDNKPVYLKDIQTEFEADECPQLQNKPKLFFIQTCRGQLITKLPSIEQVEADGACGSTTPPPPSAETSADAEIIQFQHKPDDNFANNIPHNADMHVAYATTEGYLSLRNNRAGSWFIQAITEVFLKHAHEENLDQLMNMVTDRVASQKGKLYGDTERAVMAKQTPERVSRMRKTLYFLPKYSEST